MTLPASVSAVSGIAADKWFLVEFGKEKPKLSNRQLQAIAIKTIRKTSGTTNRKCWSYSAEIVRGPKQESGDNTFFVRPDTYYCVVRATFRSKSPRDYRLYD